jgi:hypothetical protein
MEEKIHLLEEKKDSNVEIRTIYNKKYSRKVPLSKSMKIIIFLLLLLFSPLIITILLFLFIIFILLNITCILPIILMLYDYFRTNSFHKNRKLPKNLKYFDIGGYNLACAFSDNVFSKDEEDLKKPIVVFIPGVGVPPSSIFHYLELYYKDYRLCAFDKGSNGLSDPVPNDHKLYKRDAKNSSEELNLLLHHKDFPLSVKDEKVILIGGSQGGLVSHYYSYKYPEDINGVIFVDASTGNFQKHKERGLLHKSTKINILRIG